MFMVIIYRRELKNIFKQRCKNKSFKHSKCLWDFLSLHLNIFSSFFSISNVIFNILQKIE